MSTLRTFFAGRPVLFALWLVLCAATSLLTLKLGVFMFAPSRTDFSMVPGDEFTRHSCFSAYVTAADLLGEPNVRIYDPANYERNAPDASRRIPLYGFEQDKYEYTPIFLLLPKALLVFSKDFRVVRAMWFVFSIASVLGAMGLMAAWIGGRRGLSTALLIPLAWGTFTNLVTLQTGNVQYVVIAMAAVAMIAFERRRPALGGALLAFAIGIKLYPALLLFGLVAQRRYREIAWTAACGLVFCGAVLVIAGPQPFIEFLTYQLPRLLSGESFAFFKELPRNVAMNLSLYGLPYKLHLLGLVRDPDRLSPLLGRSFTLLLLALTAYVAWRGAKRAPPKTSDERAGLAIEWLALLSLASLQSAFAPPYVVLSLIWLLTLWAPGERLSAKRAVLFTAGWLGLTCVIPEPLGLLLATAWLVQAIAVGIGLVALLRFPPSGEGPGSV